MKKVYFTILILLFTLQSFLAGGQTTLADRGISQVAWNAYFKYSLHLTKTDTIITETTKIDIPFPKKWKYANEDENKLYSFENSDYLFMPGPNDIGTYMMFVDRGDIKKSFLEMNFTADSIICERLPQNILLFRLINSEFVQKSDTLKLNRYILTNTYGQISSKAILTHGCTLSYNSIDTLHHTIYFNVEYPNRPTCVKCLHFNYLNNLLASPMLNVAGTQGSITIDDVHYTAITHIEGK